MHFAQCERYFIPHPSSHLANGTECTEPSVQQQGHRMRCTCTTPGRCMCRSSFSFAILVATADIAMDTTCKLFRFDALTRLQMRDAMTSSSMAVTAGSRRGTLMHVLQLRCWSARGRDTPLPEFDHPLLSLPSLWPPQVTPFLRSGPSLLSVGRSVAARHCSRARPTIFCCREFCELVCTVRCILSASKELLVFLVHLSCLV